MDEPDSRQLQPSYDTAYSKNGGLESVLRSLKDGLISVQPTGDLCTGDYSDSDAVSFDGQELAVLVERQAKQIDCLLNEISAISLGKENGQLEVRRLTEALALAKSRKLDISAKADDLNYVNEKMTRKITALKDEVKREADLRSALEESQDALVTRLHDLEDCLMAEKDLRLKSVKEGNTLKTEVASLKTCLETSQRMQEESKRMAKVATADYDDLEKKHIAMMAKLKTTAKSYSDSKRENRELRDGSHRLLTEHERYKYEIERMHEEGDQLHEALKQTAVENIQLQDNAKEQIRALESEAESRLEAVERVNQQLRAKLDREQDEQERLKQRIATLHAEINGLQEKSSGNNAHLVQAVEDRNEVIETLRTKVEELTSLKTQSNVLRSSDQTCTGTLAAIFHREESDRIMKLELTTAVQHRDRLAEDNSHLQERVSSLQLQMDSHRNVDGQLADLVEGKNRLAFQKGRLQAKVKELEDERCKLPGLRDEIQHLKRSNSHLDNQVEKLSRELSSGQMESQRHEARQLHCNNLIAQRDVQLADLQRKYEEVDGQRNLLEGQLEAEQEQLAYKKTSNERNLEEMKCDNRKLQDTLEMYMKSHKTLQVSLEEAQIQLGEKDSELTSFRKVNSDSGHQDNRLKVESMELARNSVAMEIRVASEVGRLRKNDENICEENKRLRENMDKLLEQHGILQTVSNRLQEELSMRCEEIAQLRQTRVQDQEVAKETRNHYEEQVTGFKEISDKENIRSCKQLKREIADLKRKSVTSQEKLSRMTSSNQELRKHHETDKLELERLNDKLKATKATLELVQRKNRAREEADSTNSKLIRDEIDKLEVKGKLQQETTSDQVRAMNAFLALTTNLESEITALTGANSQMMQVCQAQKTKLSSPILTSKQNSTGHHPGKPFYAVTNGHRILGTHFRSTDSDPRNDPTATIVPPLDVSAIPAVNERLKQADEMVRQSQLTVKRLHEQMDKLSLENFPVKPSWE